MNIFVAKLNYKTTTDGLRAAFEAFGEVTAAKVVFDHNTGKSKCYGFVEMANDDEGSRAVSALNNADLDGSTIVVQESDPSKRQAKKPFEGGGGGGYGGGYDGGGYKKRFDNNSGGGYGGGDRPYRRDNDGGGYKKRFDNNDSSGGYKKRFDSNDYGNSFKKRYDD